MGFWDVRWFFGSKDLMAFMVVVMFSMVKFGIVKTEYSYKQNDKYHCLVRLLIKVEPNNGSKNRFEKGHSTNWTLKRNVMIEFPEYILLSLQAY